MDYEEEQPGRNKKILIALAAVAIAGIALYFVFFSQGGFAPIEKEYTASYLSAEMLKVIKINGSSHTEEISLSTANAQLDVLDIIVVPKALASDINSINSTTNGLLKVFDERGLLELRAKNIPNEVSLRLSLSGGKDICTINVLFPVSFVDGLSETQKGQLVGKLLMLDSNLSCSKASELENRIGEEFIGAFAG